MSPSAKPLGVTWGVNSRTAAGTLSGPTAGDTSESAGAVEQLGEAMKEGCQFLWSPKSSCNWQTGPLTGDIRS